MEILEWLKLSVKCEYISDMRDGEYNRLAKAFIKGADFSKYTLNEVTNAVEYIYGKENKFASKGEAVEFLQGKS